jgi:hypothetical protein
MKPRPLLRFEPDLQEAVVLQEVTRRCRDGDESVREQYRRGADAVYRRFDHPRLRRAAFVSLHARLFDALGCSQPFGEALERLAFPVERVVVARAWHPGEEGAEISPDRATLGIRIMVERFGSPDLSRWLDHELGHVADMLDPAFGYGQSAAPPPTAALRRLQGERFGLLWDCVVDGRSARAGRVPLAGQDERCEAFRRLFPECPEALAPLVVGRLWDGERPTYAALCEYARHWQALAAWAGVPAQAVATGRDRPAAVPGGPCPLCGFPTFRWAAAIPEEIAARISEDFPEWTAALGACERCVEGYGVAVEIGGRL